MSPPTSPEGALPLLEANSMHDPSTDRDLIASMRSRILDAVAPILDGAARCALVGYPNHNNSGDNAIWLGELELLASLGVDVAYQCDDVSYNDRDLADVLPDGPILLHGGGNYGDLWPEQQALRERVMRDFPARHVVQLPQTVNFVDPRTADAHRQFLQGRDRAPSMLCRDGVSALFARERLGIDAVLCPDSAFFLNLAVTEHPAVDVVVNSRLDHESVGEGPLTFPGFSVEHSDWLLSPGARSVRRALTVRSRTTARSLAARTTRTGLVWRGVRRIPMFGSRRLAERRVAHACRLLSRGRVVVTDRLHGHILSILLGIPHIIRDTQHHKVANFHETFTHRSRTTFQATGSADVVALVQRLLDEVTDQRC